MFSFVFAKPIERTKYIMGTYISIVLPEENKNLFKEAFNIFKEVDNKFSKYRPDSYVYKLNKNKVEKIDNQVLDLLKICLDIYRETDGYFDITLGNFTKKFGIFYEESYKSSSENLGIENIEIKNDFIYLKNNISLDFGGIGKGYAVDLVADFLKKNGISKAVIKASGDIRCLDICYIGIKNPFSEGIIFSFWTKNPETAISTSGNYERYIGNTKNNHLINPKTKKSQTLIASITLISIANNTYLDAYATAVSVMPLEKALNFLDKKDIAYIIFTTDRKKIVSKNICKFIVCN
ncbi:MAG: FAD:protein FMN transferase [Hydrogenothermus sp.]|nr:MAG: FAD:protein FMN transferase [Hydrogenothermus sp.]